MGLIAIVLAEMAGTQTARFRATPTMRLGLRARLRAAHDARMASERPRRRLARQLEHAIARAEQRYTPFSAAIPVCHEAAAGEARSALLDLAERLRGPRPVDPDGVRLARELLVDGAGPLYAPAEPGQLRAAALRALRALDAHGADRQAAQ